MERDEAFQLKLDRPADMRLDQPVGTIRGWFAASGEESVELLQFRIGGTPARHIVEDRRDVEEILPEHVVTGFLLPFDLSFYMPHIHDQRLTIAMNFIGHGPILLRFSIAEKALAACLATAGGV